MKTLYSILALGLMLPYLLVASPASTQSLLPSSPVPWTCWGPDSHLPCYPNLSVITAYGDQVWFSDSRSPLIQFDGQSFHHITLPAGSSSGLRSLDAVGSDDLWAIGGGHSEKVLRWHNGKWQDVSPATSLFIPDLDMLSATDGWLIGLDHGTSTWGIYHWDGNSWELEFTYDNDLVFISMDSDQFGWAINRSGARILWDGSQWTEHSSSIPDQYSYTLVTLSPAEAWVGQSNGMARWNGESWELYTPPYAAFILHLAFISPTDGWAASESGRIYHWDGTAWEMMSFQSDESLGALAAHSGNVWASGQHGAVYHLSQAGLEEIAPNASKEQKIRRNGIDLLSSQDGWAVGDQGLIEHWDGESWQSVESPTTSDLRKVVMLSPTSGWAVGSADVLRFLDGEWTIAVGSSPLYDIDLLSEDCGWAVGSTTILRWDGSQWQVAFLLNPGEILYGLDMLSSDEGWAVSSSGRIYRWDGQDWNLHSTVDAPLYDIVMLSDDQGFAVGGNIYLYDGASWQPALPPPESPTIWLSLAFRSQDEGYAVGLDGLMAHWDGQAWSVLPKVTGWTLSAVDFAPDGAGWAVGELSRLRFLSHYSVFLPFIHH